MAPNMHHSAFLISHLCILKYGRSVYRTTALLSETFFVWFHLTGELSLQTYISRSLKQHCVHKLQAHTYITTWCATMQENKTNVVEMYECRNSAYELL